MTKIHQSTCWLRFIRVCPATENKVDPIMVLTVGVKARSTLDGRRCLGIIARTSTECKYCGCVDESACLVRI